MTVAETKTDWDIRGDGRAWSGDEAMQRYFSTPRKIEMIEGKLFDDVEDRENMLCLLLENVGADRVVQFGDPNVWRTALSKLKS